MTNPDGTWAFSEGFKGNEKEKINIHYANTCRNTSVASGTIKRPHLLNSRLSWWGHVFVISF